MLQYRGALKPNSRTLRKHMTNAEILLWSRVRKHQLAGFPFSRQKIIGPYIVDFYCPRAKLVVEVDGSQHYYAGNIEKDRIRDKYMTGQGLSVLRVTDTDVLTNIEGVLEIILQHLGLVGGKTPLIPLCKGGEVSRIHGGKRD